jgi:deoxyadenosine/deoxycytidine kinase
MIVIINGPLGIGKSETSWQLLYRLPRAVMLDMDHIAAFHPCDYYCQEHLDYAYSTAGILVEHHVRHGFSDFILNWVFESPDQLARLKKELARFDQPIHSFRLRCEPDEIARRIRARNREDLDGEIARSRELVAILDAAAQTGDIGTVIDTTSLTVEQTVDRIWDQVQAANAGLDRR